MPSARRSSSHVEAMMMDDLVLWSSVMGGTPLALVLIGRAVEWSLDAIGAGPFGRRSEANGRPASDTMPWRMHA
jgi:hypothetical protein